MSDVNADSILDVLKRELRLHPLRVLCIYQYGSRCYNTYISDSDYDFIIIAKNSVENIEHNIGEYNFHVQTPDYFQSRLDWNCPKSIECMNYPPLLEKYKFEYSINHSKFRHAVSHINSNSWVKAKKKILQGDTYIGQKSLFHSLRIPLYAIQILESGEIYDWEIANDYWQHIKTIDNWDVLEDGYKGIKNSIMTKFRSICAK